MDQISIETKETTSLIIYYETESGLISGYLFEIDQDTIDNISKNILVKFVDIGFKCKTLIKIANVLEVESLSRGRYIFVPLLYLLAL